MLHTCFSFVLFFVFLSPKCSGRQYVDTHSPSPPHVWGPFKMQAKVNICIRGDVILGIM